MLRPEEMVKVRVTCHKAQLPDVIEALYAAKAIHIVEHRKDAVRDIGSPLPAHEQVSRALLKLRALLSSLSIGPREAKPVPSKDLAALERRIDAVQARATGLVERQKALETELAATRAERSALALLGRFDVSPDELKGSERLAVLFGTAKGDEGLAARLSALTTRLELSVEDHEGAKGVLLAIDSSYAPQALQILSTYGFAEVKPAAGSLKEAERRIVSAEQAAKAAAKELASLAHEHADFLLGAERALSTEAEKTGAPLGFAVTGATAAATGWVPKSRVEKLERAIDTVTGKRHLFERLPLDRHEAGPVELDNPSTTRPFQALLDLYSLPNSREIDPTLFLFITFPIFFGFMLGDIGYGMVTLALFLFLKTKLPKARDLLNVMVWTSIWSIVFGLAFGEFFGFEELGHFAIPHLLSRSHGVAELITIALLIGVAHMLMGLVIGFFNVLHHHGLGHAVKEKVGWMLMLPGIVKILILLGLVEGHIGETLDHVLPGLPLVILAGLGLVLIILGEGVKGAIELPGIFSNILSYARLMALGIASVSLAIVINEFTEQFAVQGGAMIIVAILIFAIGHAVNIALGIIGPFLHSLRLHYVELFGKFFEGGGERFKPFGTRTEDD